MPFEYLDEKPSLFEYEEEKPQKKNLDTEEAIKAGKAVLGVGETAASLFAGLPSQIAGGLYGLGTLLSGQGLEKAAAATDRIQRENFGFGAYEPSTEVGKRGAKQLQELFAKPGELAGEAGAFIGKQLGNEELGRLSAKLPTDVLMNFLPISGVHLGGKAVGKKLYEPKIQEKPVENLQEKLSKAEESTSGKFEYIEQPIPETNIGRPQGAIPENASIDVMHKIAESQLGSMEPMYKRIDPMESIVQGLEKQRQERIQAELDNRQKAMEQNVSRQQQLDYNAAERARQENAPTGYAEHVAEQARTEYTKAISDIEQLKRVEQEEAINAQNARNVAERSAAEARQLEAQKAIEARQAALEFEVKRQQQLDFGAAERQRMGITEGPYGSQRGVIDLKTLEEGFKRIKDISNGIKLTATGDGTGLRIEAFDVSGKKLGTVGFSPDNWLNPKATDSLRADWVESHSPGLAKEMYKYASELGNDIQPAKVQTSAGKAMWDKFEAQGISNGKFIPKGQRGAVDFKAISDSLVKQVEGLSKLNMKGVSGKSVADYARDIPGMGNALDNIHPRPESGVDALQKILAEGKDGPSLVKGIQAGPELTGEKVGSGLMKHTSQWLQWAWKKAESADKTIIKPLENKITNLKQLAPELADILKYEEGIKTRLTPEQMMELGVKGKVLEAYTELRKQLDDTLVLLNKGREKLGMEPVDGRTAYSAALRHGEYHLTLKDKTGRPIWHIQETSARNLYKAINWFKENAGQFPDLDLGALDKYTNFKVADFKGLWGNAEIMKARRVSNMEPTVPRDMIQGYIELMQMIDESHPSTQAIQFAIHQATEKAGYNLYGEKNRFMKKAGVRGFEGDKPWLNAEENSKQFLDAQIEYLRTSQRWAHMQEAVSEIKPLLSNEELIKQQPNNVEYTKAVVSQQLGLTQPLLKGVEDAVMGMFGSSRADLRQAVHSLKAVTYGLQLGQSVGYMIGTPITALFSTGMALRERGIGALSPTVVAKSMMDISGGLLTHLYNEGGKTNTNIMMTDIGREALKYAENNHILPEIVQGETAFLNPENTPGARALGVHNATIALPEKVQRLSSFMAFVHHLNEMGTYKNLDSLFKRAEELTNMSSTNMRPSERPLMVGQLGSFGEAAYTYKAPVFNYFNQLSLFAREAVDSPKTKTLPLVGLLGMTLLLGGATNLPGVDAIDGVWNAIKNGVAEHSPEHYSALVGTKLGRDGLKGSIMSSLPESAAYGVVSSMSGVQMGSRFAPQLGDPSQMGLLNAAAPVAQELKEWGSLAKYLADPNRQTAIQGVYDAAATPLMKGVMETTLPDFKSGPRDQQGRQAYVSPTHMAERTQVSVRRTPEDEKIRMLGLKSMPEYKYTEANYIAGQEAKRRNTAYEGLVGKMVVAAKNNRPEDAKRFASGAIELNPDSDAFNTAVNRALSDATLTNVEKDIIRNKVKSIQRTMQFKELQGK